jgi:hypothetical protein
MIDTFTLWIEYRKPGYVYEQRKFEGISRVAIDYYEKYYSERYDIINIGWEETKYLKQ